MNTWKVILATLVIFVAGLVTGGMAVKRLTARVNAEARRPPPILPRPLRAEFVQRLERELDLSPEQHTKILDIVQESQERVRLLYDKIGPDLGEEMRTTREQIRAQLTPEQQRKFEQLQRRQLRNPNSGPEPPDPAFRDRRPFERPRPPEREGPPRRPPEQR